MTTDAFPLSSRRGYRVPISIELGEDGGYVVSSPALPEFNTCGDTLDEAMHNLPDCLEAVLECYEEIGRTVPVDVIDGPTEFVVSIRAPMAVLSGGTA